MKLLSGIKECDRYPLNFLKGKFYKNLPWCGLFFTNDATQTICDDSLHCLLHLSEN